MVDFKKRLSNQDSRPSIIPTEIYDRLDRASDKGPLRPAQLAVLETWHSDRRNQKDVVLKLHTGQGKTLVGLLMLQSKIFELGLPGLYLCPNNQLVSQTIEQAELFGIKACRADSELPHEFLDGKSILITSVHKLFNGRTKFGLSPHSLPVGAVVLDDCHACADIIREQLTIRLEKKTSAYREIVQLFGDDLEGQGSGSFAEIQAGTGSAVLAVPYWAWIDRKKEVIGIIAKQTSDDGIAFGIHWFGVTFSSPITTLDVMTN